MAKILVVDDQLGVRRLLYETFRENQHDVKIAANGMEALELAKTFNPDLILMDMKMPGMSGIETLRQMRAMNLMTQVILMTAYGDLHNMTQAEELGIIHYLTKPFDLFELRDKVAEILVAQESK
ncbi:MAG: response regulator [Desulfitobacteriaceae bacterium]|nr:response regulator [Desulfitobacteriaceae bacterium]MDI6913633.1 response regulator [Desulfitobacteriaceae bacterium]